MKTLNLINGEWHTKVQYRKTCNDITITQKNDSFGVNKFIWINKNNFEELRKFLLNIK